MRAESQHSSHEHFMDRAIALARRAMEEEDGPVGCVIVKGGSILGEGRNTANTSQDPTAHAELNVVREVTLRLGEGALIGSTLYTSMEPCPMCGWAILNAQIATVVLGARHADFHTREYGAYSIEALATMTGRHLEVIKGLREAECQNLRYSALERLVRAQSTAQSSVHSIARGTCASAGYPKTRDSAGGVRRLFRGLWSDVLRVFRRRSLD